MKIVTHLFYFSMLYSLAGNLSAAPNITAMDTNQINLGKIVVHGNGFGAGPSINVYDDFEGDGVVGAKIPTTSAKVGEWGLPIAGASLLPTFDNIAHSGKLSARMYDQKQKGFRQQFAGTTEIFISYWVLVPPGTPFPGGVAGSFPNVSSWKFAWMYDQNYNGTDSDICLPTHVGNGNMGLMGNDLNLITNLGNSWWDWGNWIRISVWLKADESNPLANGTIEFQTVSTNKGLATRRSTTIPIFDADYTNGDGTKQFRTFTIPGWISPLSSTATRILYDDIYVSLGKNSAARVEIGDKPNYADSTLLSIQTPSNWTDNTITIDVRKGGFTSIEGAYLYVTDANGNVNSSGIKINSGMIVKQPDSPTDLIAN